MSFTHKNHYVPEWYQRRFFSDSAKEEKYYYLNLKPKTTQLANGVTFAEKNPRHYGPVSCFVEEDLYTTYFGSQKSDKIEKQLFGTIDTDGHKAIDYFSDYKIKEGTIKAWQDLVEYMDAQVLRTPRGLARIKQMVQTTDHNKTLAVMQNIRRLHATMWTECTWEIMECDKSGIDLIISDNPVTFYNRAIFPGASECAFPLEPHLELLGTQTLFPLRKDRLLVLTHLQFARDPSYDPKKPRINPRYYSPTIFSLLDIITERQMTAEDVLKINYIIKSRAHQFIASSTEEGLYPEKHLKSTFWTRLSKNEFLLPDPREITFTTNTIIGYENGSVWGMDEYGRQPTGKNEMQDKNRARESIALKKRQKEWDKKYGPLGKLPAHFRN